MREIPYIQILVGIVILGLALRFYHLDFNSLWLDEAATYANINSTNIFTVLTNVYNDHHAPLFFVCVWLVHFIGSTEFWLRLPSLVAGTGTIFVIYFLGKEVVNEKVGIIAALLLALSPYHIYYSQEARMYAVAVFFVTLAFYLFFKASKSTDNRYWILMWLSCVAAFYTHFYTGFITIPLVVGYCLLVRKDNPNLKFIGNIPKGFKEFVAGGILAIILVLPILNSFFSQSKFLLDKTITWGLNAWMIPFATLSSFSFQNEMIGAIFLLLAGLGFWVTYKKSSYTAWILFVFLFIPFLFSIIMSKSIPFNVRYHMYLLPLFLVIISIAIERLTHLSENHTVTIAAVFLIFLCALITLPPYYSQISKEDWRGFTSRLSQTTSPGDTVVLVPSYMSLPFNYYYSNSTDGTVQLGANAVSDFEQIPAKNRVYYIVTNDIYAVNPKGDELRWLQQNTKPLGQYAGIYLFVKG